MLVLIKSNSFAHICATYHGCSSLYVSIITIVVFPISVISLSCYFQNLWKFAKLREGDEANENRIKTSEKNEWTHRNICWFDPSDAYTLPRGAPIYVAQKQRKSVSSQWGTVRSCWVLPCPTVPLIGYPVFGLDRDPGDTSAVRNSILTGKMWVERNLEW